jgi:uncharacterized membrane protein
MLSYFRYNRVNMNSRSLFALAAVVGIVCGFLSTHALNIGWLNLVFWGAAGIALGYFSATKKDTLLVGAIYGFFLSISFLFSGFQGAPDKFAGFALFSLGLSIIGALGGLVSAFVGGWLKSKLSHGK